ncbi:transglutaminase-like putative cysteine protease [Arthrobacter stackebrandtii]|uniref:Transglutaminase-like putative cysteine protease n=1 Tax=Arthrobacter stackebrandtii TaxID=272161 RepID=A0ABS4YS14_9MICC|nr:DUF3488 and transglutaminase-like domain-containing protein [Arthrobacter stackebrandtii]MBP2411579.1 transglutaminase-like putative cysteine protease [Arthrobacter stackebrandtii]PYG99258.1 transglutaminase [Arthrobacter stackebrandtii]
MTGTLHAPPAHDGGAPAPHKPVRRLLGTPATGPARWVMAMAIFAAVMAASFGLGGVVRNMTWLPQAAVVVGGTLLVPALLRRWPALSPFAPVGALAGWFMSLTLVFFPGTAILGVIPTPGTVSAAMDLAAKASSVVMSNVAPVPADVSMHFMFSAGLGFAALLIDTLAITVSMPAASALGLVLILLPAALTTSTGVGTAAFVGTAAGYLLILGCARWYAPNGKLRTDTPKVASGILAKGAALGAAVVLLMALATQAVPGFTEGLYPQGSQLSGTGEGGTLDPMLSLGDDLRSQSSRVTMRYQSTARETPYMRMTTLEDFTGKVWEPSELPKGLSQDLTSLSPAAGPAPGVPLETVQTKVTVPGVGDPWLAAPLSATSVDQLPGQWWWNPVTQTIKSTNATSAGKSYLVTSAMPVLTQEALNAATAPPRSGLDPVFSELPKDVPAVVGKTAGTVTAGAATPYEKAMAIQDYLRSDEFSYSLSTPVVEGYDGSGMAVLADFLKQKSGYCVHFSAAMAVMAREVGIPSRIAVGYTQGVREAGEDVQGADGELWRGYEVTGRDAHAWPELYFEGLGWVPFEPTPSRGAVPDYALDAGASAPIPEPNPTGNSAAPTDSATSAAATTAAAAAAGEELGIDIVLGLQRAGLVLLALCVLLIPALVRWMARRMRLAAIRGVWRPLGRRQPSTTPAWQELTDTAIDYGVPYSPALTPSMQADAVAAHLGSTRPPGLDVILQATERTLYGGELLDPGGREDLAEAVEQMVARFRSSATPWRRFCARYVPASLFTFLRR